MVPCWGVEGAPCYSPPESWLGKDFVGEELRAGRGQLGGVVGKWGCALGVMMTTTEQGTLVGRGATWPCTIGVWGLTSSDLFGIGANMVLDLGRKIPLQERQAETLSLWVPQHTVVPKYGTDGEQNLCTGLVKDAEKVGEYQGHFGLW